MRGSSVQIFEVGLALLVLRLTWENTNPLKVH